MSAFDTYLISAARAKAVTACGPSPDEKINPWIFEAQHALEEILGSTLYTLLEAGDPANDRTLGGNAGLATLYVQYCERFLAFRTIQLAYPDMMAGAQMNGVFQRNGNDYNTVDPKVFGGLIGGKRSASEVQEIRMLKYLRDLPTTDPIRIAFDANVNCEPRTTTPAIGRISTRKSKWQQQYGGDDMIGSRFGPDRHEH